MREPTKEEINLFKQIAKKYRKGIDYGDWYWHEVDEDVFLHSTKEKYPYVADAERAYIIPLWTISDCLEFLEEKTTDWSLDKDIDREGRQTGKFSFWWMPSPKYKDNYRLGKTKLEACLKAVLAVLEEKEK